MCSLPMCLHGSTAYPGEGKRGVDWQLELLHLAGVLWQNCLQPSISKHMYLSAGFRSSSCQSQHFPTVHCACASSWLLFAQCLGQHEVITAVAHKDCIGLQMPATYSDNSWCPHPGRA